MDEGHGMNSYEIVNNEFKPRQPNPIVWNRCQGEGIIRISHIHHDLGFGPFEVFEIDPV